MRKTILIGLLTFLFVPTLVSANIIAPISWSLITFILLPLIILLEGLVFWILAKKWLKIKLGFWKLVLVVLIANIATSLIGSFVSAFMYDIEYSFYMVMAFVISVLVEGGLFTVLFKRMKILKKIKIKDKQLFLISLYVNIASYLPLLIFINP